MISSIRRGVRRGAFLAAAAHLLRFVYRAAAVASGAGWAASLPAGSGGVPIAWNSRAVSASRELVARIALSCALRY
ncbi:hypothetical protein, partial [Burkholderia gladioli]|uniref:hypothetical protein n=1 Tax=Burkholderia gladioli TaxID=28095 RepID=UPI0034DB3309